MKSGFTASFVDIIKPLRVSAGLRAFTFVPGLSSSSSASSSSTSLPQDSSSTTASPPRLRSEFTRDQVSGDRSDPSKNQKQNKNQDNQEAAGSRLRDLPEWLKEFTENLEDTEAPALANTSHDSDSERTTKVASRKQSIKTHFPKDRNCEVCKRTKITRAP